MSVSKQSKFLLRIQVSGLVILFLGISYLSAANSGKPPPLEFSTSAGKSFAHAMTVAPEMHSSSGTISFWVRPEWSQSMDHSHALVSARWKSPHGAESYLAISQGWWEPQYADRIHFIVSNANQFGCSSHYQLPTNVWILVTAVWRGGEDAFCKLFIDDQLVARRLTHVNLSLSVIDSITFGDDSAAMDYRHRTSPARFSDVKTWTRPLTDSEVIQRYRNEEWQDVSTIENKKWHWMHGGGESDSADHSQRRRVLAIFDEGEEWSRSPAAIDTRLAKIKAAGFNAYFPCVWHGRGTRYPSSIAPPESQLLISIKKGWDPLKYLITKAHANGIEVHPWFTVALREGNDYPQFFDGGTPAGAYDIHNIEFRKFISDLVLDVVRRYDIDGINLDYIRSIGICTSRHCIDDYKSSSGRDLLSDIRFSGTADEARSSLQNWQDRAVGGLVKDISERSRNVRPKLIMSVDSDVETEPTNRPLQGRNELSWANTGMIDLIFHMDYAPFLNVQRIERARIALKESSKLIVLIGNYDTIDGKSVPRDADWISHVTSFVLNQRHSVGLGVYLLSQLDDQQIAALHTILKHNLPNNVNQHQTRSAKTIGSSQDSPT